MKSIKDKITLSILGVTFVVIALMWFFQVILMENIYLMNKKNDMNKDTRSIISMIIDSNLKIPTTQIAQLCYQKNYSIEIYDNNVGITNSFAPRGSQSLFSDNGLDREKLMFALSFLKEDEYYNQRIESEYGSDFYVVATHQKYNGSDYTVVIASALAPVREAVYSIKNQLVIISILLILFACGVAYFLSHSLTKPIKKLSKATKEIAKGDFSVQVHVKSKDELGLLADNFNYMAREIARASALQKELVANVSHDIRTPLTMIKGYAETIKDLTGDIKQKRDKQLDIIIDESNRLNLLVNDILDLSKLQAGQLTLNVTEFNISTKLKDIVSRYDLLKTNEGFSFDVVCPPDIMVKADEIKIEQVLYNIINNATNHTGADKKIFIRLDDYEDKVIISIKDTGKGIKQEDIPFIWDRYYKPYKKDDRKGMGTGLGLSIVKAILTTHGFNFGVNSKIGEGSIFWFEIKK